MRAVPHLRLYKCVWCVLRRFLGACARARMAYPALTAQITLALVTAALLALLELVAVARDARVIHAVLATDPPPPACESPTAAALPAEHAIATSRIQPCWTSYLRKQGWRCHSTRLYHSRRTNARLRNNGWCNSRCGSCFVFIYLHLVGSYSPCKLLLLLSVTARPPLPRCLAPSI